MTAWVNGIVGFFLSFWLAQHFLEQDWIYALQAPVVSVLCGLFTIFVTLKFERIEWVKKTILFRSRNTWIVFLTLYFAPLIAFNRILHSPQALLTLVVPLILSTGFSIVIFGPIQDYLVARRSKRKIG